MNDVLAQKFFQDPDWGRIEDMMLKKMDALFDMNTVDLTAPSEHVKAEIVGRKLAYNALAEFLNDTKIIGRKITKVDNIFR